MAMYVEAVMHDCTLVAESFAEVSGLALKQPRFLMRTRSIRFESPCIPGFSGLRKSGISV